MIRTSCLFSFNLPYRAFALVCPVFKRDRTVRFPTSRQLDSPPAKKDAELFAAGRPEQAQGVKGGEFSEVQNDGKEPHRPFKSPRPSIAGPAIGLAIYRLVGGITGTGANATTAAESGKEASDNVQGALRESVNIIGKDSQEPETHVTGADNIQSGLASTASAVGFFPAANAVGIRAGSFGAQRIFTSRPADIFSATAFVHKYSPPSIVKYWDYLLDLAEYREKLKMLKTTFVIMTRRLSFIVRFAISRPMAFVFSIFLVFLFTFILKDILYQSIASILVFGLTTLANGGLGLVKSVADILYSLL